MKIKSFTGELAADDVADFFIDKTLYPTFPCKFI